MNILLFSNLFPNVVEPERGLFAVKKIARLRSRHNFRVVAPIAYFPVLERRRQYSRLPRHTTVEGIPVWYPRPLYLPVLGRRWNSLLLANSVRSLIAQLHTDSPIELIWATWGSPDVVAAVSLARTLRLPVVAELHGSDVNSGLQIPWCRRQMLAAFEQCRMVITRSESMRQMLAHEGVPQAKLICIYNGADHDLFRPMERAAALAQLGWSADPQRLLYVGLLAPLKGVADLLQAFAKIVRGTHRPVELVIAGFGPQEAELKKLAHRLGVGDKTRFLGRVPHAELAPYYNAADVVCLPSYQEGMPNVLLEAQACGRPIVATNVGGIPDLAPDARYGFLYNPGDTDALADRLTRALDWPFDSAEILRHSANFSWERSAQVYDRVFTYAAGRGPRPGTTTVQIASPAHKDFRVTLVSRLFPNRLAPVNGAFNLHIAVALQKHVHVEVIAPISFTTAKRVLPLYSWSDALLVRHPRYASLRGLNRLTAGCLLAQALADAPTHAEILLASNAWPDGYAAVKLARRRRLPIVVNVIGSDVDLLPRLGPRRRQTLWALRTCDHIYAVAGGLRDKLIALGLPAAKITVIRNGVDTKLFFPRPAEPIRRELGLPLDRPTVLFAGNVTRDKGVDDLLAALATLTPRPFVLIVGPCAQRNHYHRQICRHGLANDCRLVPAQPKTAMPKWYAAADLFVLPSWHEGCPNVVLEALACGRPVVATNVGGIPELLAPAHMLFAELVPPRSPPALAAAIQRMLAQPLDPDAITPHANRTWDDVAADLNALLRAVHQQWFLNLQRQFPAT